MKKSEILQEKLSFKMQTSKFHHIHIQRTPSLIHSYFVRIILFPSPLLLQFYLVALLNGPQKYFKSPTLCSTLR